MSNLKVKIEMVTNVNKPLYEQIEAESHNEKDTLWFQHGGWYQPSDVKHTWNNEKYLLVRDVGKETLVLGYFTITKHHEDLRAVIQCFYISPKYRKKNLTKHMMLFIGNKVFGELGYNKIEACAWESNENVVKLYDSIMEREGTRKEKYYYNRKFHTEILWGVTYKDSIWAGNTELEMKHLEQWMK